LVSYVVSTLRLINTGISRMEHMVHTGVGQLLPSLIITGLLEKKLGPHRLSIPMSFFGCWVGYSKKLGNSSVCKGGLSNN
jgi:hypothetical protein